MKLLSKLYWWWVSLPFDKKAHLSIGKDAAWITLTMILALSMISQWFYLIPAVSMSFVIGFGRELYDKYVKRTLFDKEDLKYTIYGGIPVTIYQYLFIIVYQLIKNYWVL